MAHTSRRWFLQRAAALGAVAALWPARALHSQPAPVRPAPAPGWLPETEAAVQRGLSYLESKLNEQGTFGPGEYERQVSVVSLATMAFLASGTTPERGPYRNVVTRCVNYVLASARPNGLIAEPRCPDRMMMYGHGFSTLMLAEVCGMTANPALRDVLSAATRLIADSIGPMGGWRYTPTSVDADTSVTSCQLVALRAARNAGLHVPHDVVQRAYQFLLDCQNPDGGFRYMLVDGPSEFPRSAGSLAALHIAGDQASQGVINARRYVLGFQADFERSAGQWNGRLPPEQQYFHYGQYYAAQALWQAGEESWAPWFAAIQPLALSLQRDDGSWTSDFGTPLATAMMLIVLQLPNNMLPVLQR